MYLCTYTRVARENYGNHLDERHYCMSIVLWLHHGSFRIWIYGHLLKGYIRTYSRLALEWDGRLYIL